MIRTLTDATLSAQYTYIIGQQPEPAPAAEEQVPGTAPAAALTGGTVVSAQSLSVLLETQQVTKAGASPTGGYQQGTFQNDFLNLVRALRGSDLDGAKQAFATLAQLNSGENGVDFAAIGVPAPVEKLLARVGDSLAGGDLAGAQAAVFPQVGGTTVSAQQAAATPGAFLADFGALTGALRSGDLTNARQIYADFTQRWGNSDTLDALGVPSEMRDALITIGHNLEDYNLGGASTTLDAFIAAGSAADQAATAALPGSGAIASAASISLTLLTLGPQPAG